MSGFLTSGLRAKRAPYLLSRRWGAFCFAGLGWCVVLGLCGLGDKLVSMASVKKLSPSAQMALVTGLVEGAALLALALALLVNFGSPTTVMTTFMVLVVISLIASLLATVLSFVGLVRYVRFQLLFVLILVLSIIFNPAVLLGVLAILD